MNEAKAKQLALQIAESRAAIKEHEDIVKEKQAELVKMMGEDEVFPFQEGGYSYTTTKVAGSKTVLDQPSLKKKIGALWWNKLSPRVLDMKRLEAAMVQNEGLSTIVASCATEVPSTPYVKVTRRKQKRGE